MNTLIEYCQLNGLEINTTKTKVMVFRKGGRPGRTRVIRCAGEIIQVVDQYQYLGVPFAQSGLFDAASRFFMGRARSALGALWKTLITGRVSSWDSRCRLFHSTVCATLMYGSSVWCLRYMDEVECIQSRFLKMLMALPMSTPGYMLRLETGLSRLNVMIMRRVLKFWRRLLTMEPTRYPRRCYDDLFRQDSLGSNVNSKYNWCGQLRVMLVDLGFEHVWQGQSYDVVNYNSEDILGSLSERDLREDILRAENSSYSPAYSTIKDLDYIIPEEYLSYELPIKYMRVIAQLRCRGLQTFRYSAGGVAVKLFENHICLLCKKGQYESVQHILDYCPYYEPLRLRYTRQKPYPDILCIRSVDEAKFLLHYMEAAVKLRAFGLSE